MAVKLCEILKTTELYISKGQISRYVNYFLIKLLSQEVIDFYFLYCFYHESYLLFPCNLGQLSQHLHRSQESRCLMTKSLTSCLTWIGVETPAVVETAPEKGLEDGV